MVSRILLDSGGHIEGEFADIIQPEVERKTARRSSVSLAVSEVRRILGPTDVPEGITAGDVETILTGLGCTLAAAPDEGQQYDVTLPSWRLDLERDIDLIEEVARVYGYNRFLNTLPAFTGTVLPQPNAAPERATRQTLLAAGLSEAVSSTFCSAADAATFAPQPGSAAAIENPLSEEAGMLRPSLLPGMLTMLAANLHRDVSDIALFEIGSIFTASGASSRGNERDDRVNDRGGANEKVAERPSLVLGLAGQLGERPVDFYTLKGIVEQTAARFAARMIYYDRFPAESGLMPAYLHPGRSARLVIDGSTIGYFGQLHPVEAARRKLKTPIYLGELRLDRLYAQHLRHPMPRELSRFQPVRRDFSFLLPESTAYAQVEQAIRALGLEELTSVVPAELLRPTQNPQVPEGHFSLLLKTIFQSTQCTLREEDLQRFSEQLVAAVESLGGRLRS
jgi:phenylalanyl-tRNA synthetase beta chain